MAVAVGETKLQRLGRKALSVESSPDPVSNCCRISVRGRAGVSHNLTLGALCSSDRYAVGRIYSGETDR